MRHLTEEELQIYLDERDANLAPALLDHVKACPHCRVVLRRYQALYRSLEEDALIIPPPHLADQVIVRVRADAMTRTRSEHADLAITLVFSATALLLFFAYVDLAMLAEGFRSIFTQISEFALAPVPLATEYIEGLGQGLNLVLIGTVIILTIAIIDRLLPRKFRGHHT